MIGLKKEQPEICSSLSTQDGLEVLEFALNKLKKKLEKLNLENECNEVEKYLQEIKENQSRKIKISEEADILYSKMDDLEKEFKELINPGYILQKKITQEIARINKVLKDLNGNT